MQVADTAYWRMMEIGGPVADSGKERRAYRVWADSNSDLARDLKGVMTEMIKAQPPGESTRSPIAGSTDRIQRQHRRASQTWPSLPCRMTIYPARPTKTLRGQFS